MLRVRLVRPHALPQVYIIPPSALLLHPYHQSSLFSFDPQTTVRPLKGPEPRGVV